MNVRADSRFWIASAGKQFVSAAVLTCRDRGWLSLDDPLSRFFPDAPADKRAITVKQLLSHTSGFDQVYVADDAADRAQAVKKIMAVPLIDKPGAAFHYANNNYELAAAVVEIASGNDYQRFVVTNLFRPNGLLETGFAGGSATILPARNETPERLSRRSWGEAAVYSTAQDLARWFSALRNGRVLSREGTALLFAPVATIQEGQTALGWFLGTSPQGVSDIFTRGNEDFGPNALIYFYPKQDTLIVVLTHAGQADNNTSWSRAVLATLEPILLAKPGGRP